MGAVAGDSFSRAEMVAVPGGQAQQGRNCGSGWGQPQPGWDPCGSLSQEMLQAAWRHHLRAWAVKFLGSGGNSEPVEVFKILTQAISFSCLSSFLTLGVFTMQFSFSLILMNLWFWVKEKCALYAHEWTFYLSILCSLGISMFYTWFKKIALEYSFLECKMPCKPEHQVSLFHYTIVNKNKSLQLCLRPELFKVRGISRPNKHFFFFFCIIWFFEHVIAWNRIDKDRTNVWLSDIHMSICIALLRIET